MTTVVFLRSSGNLLDLLGDPGRVVRPEAQEDAEVGILADRGLDVRLGAAAHVAAVLEDLDLRELRPGPLEEALAALDGVGGGGDADEDGDRAALGPELGRRLAGDLARLAVVRADVGAAGVGLAVGVDRDDDLARLLKLAHLVGDARATRPRAPRRRRP